MTTTPSRLTSTDNSNVFLTTNTAESRGVLGGDLGIYASAGTAFSLWKAYTATAQPEILHSVRAANGSYSLRLHGQDGIQASHWANNVSGPFMATTPSHLITKQYVDNNVNITSISTTEPTDGSDGDLWFNPSNNELRILNTTWQLVSGTRPAVIPTPEVTVNVTDQISSAFISTDLNAGDRFRVTFNFPEGTVGDRFYYQPETILNIRVESFSFTPNVDSITIEATSTDGGVGINAIRMGFPQADANGRYSYDNTPTRELQITIV